MGLVFTPTGTKSHNFDGAWEIGSYIFQSKAQHRVILDKGRNLPVFHKNGQQYYKYRSIRSYISYYPDTILCMHAYLKNKSPIANWSRKTFTIPVARSLSTDAKLNLEWYVPVTSETRSNNIYIWQKHKKISKMLRVSSSFWVHAASLTPLRIRWSTSFWVLWGFKWRENCVTKSCAGFAPTKNIQK